jgi:hypothetical protein
VTAALRAAVYQRARGRCENPACGVELKPVGPSQFHVDHIYPHSWAPTHPDIESIANLQALCRSCNLRKADRFVDFTGRSPWTSGAHRGRRTGRRRLGVAAGVVVLAVTLFGTLAAWGGLTTERNDVQRTLLETSAQAQAEARSVLDRTRESIGSVADVLPEQSAASVDAWIASLSPSQVRDDIDSWLTEHGQAATAVGAAAVMLGLTRAMTRASSRRRS